jgi:undecaprenyl-diphosphatase
MSVIQAIILGIIQGITEFLPVSSSGHLIFIPKIFNWVDQGLSFDVVVHMGTLVAVIIYFRKKILQLITSVYKKDKKSKLNNKLSLLLILSIIPAGIVGLLAGDWIENNLRSAKLVGVGLIFWGIILLIADRYNKKQESNNKKLISLDKMSWKNALFIACAQAIALIPGTSRSGITMTAGLFAKLNKKTVAEFSFLMSIPIIALAGGLNILELFQNGLGELSLIILISGFLASAISGFFAIWGLMKIIQKWSFLPFVIYRIIIGLAIIFIL